MFKIGHCRYFDCGISIKHVLDSTSHFDLTVLTTHMPRPDEPTDSSYNIVCEYIKNHPERKFIHEVFTNPVYPAYHPFYKENFPYVQSTMADFSNFGLDIIKEYVVSNGINFKDTVYLKMDSDIIELDGEEWYTKNKDVLLRNRVCRTPIIHYSIKDEHTVEYRPGDMSRFRSDYTTIPGISLEFLTYKQIRPYEIQCYSKNKQPLKRNPSFNKSGNPIFIHVAKPSHYTCKNGYSADSWEIIDEYPEIIRTIRDDFFQKEANNSKYF